MGQSANSRRNASLDDKKERAAGRQKTRGGFHELNRDDFEAAGGEWSWQLLGGRGAVQGAFGREHVANRRTSSLI